MSITLDGIAKGYIVDQGVAVLKDFGFQDVLVEAGGDLLASGEKSPSSLWKIGIKSPRQEQGGIIARFSIRDRAVATSGDYLQPFVRDLSQHHLLDPRTGYSSPRLASASVLAKTATFADGLATAVMVLGPEAGLALIEELSGCEAYLVTKNLQTFQSKGFNNSNTAQGTS
jgi:thiamine biosynthesis lipoprotein